MSRRVGLGVMCEYEMSLYCSAERCVDRESVCTLGSLVSLQDITTRRAQKG
jgi:hypothetical protein